MTFHRSEILRSYIMEVGSVVLYPIVVVVVVCVIRAFRVLGWVQFYSLCLVEDRYMRNSMKLLSVSLATTTRLGERMS